MSALSLGTRREGGRTVVALTGDLDLATVPTLREAALAELADAGCQELVLDIAGLTFLDSTGLGCWIELRNKAEQSGKQVTFVNVPSVAQRTVDIAGLAGLFGMDGGSETSAT